MTIVHPVNCNCSQCYPAPANVQKSQQIPSSGQQKSIDCTHLYKPNEIKEILKRVGTDNSNKLMYVPSYSVEYYPNSGALVINNKNMTNDTTEIYKDGSVKHVGSWHNKEIAPAGSFVDIIEDAQNRMDMKQLWKNVKVD